MAEPLRRVLRMEAEHPVFRTHFPGQPRVPGSLVLQALLELLGERGKDGVLVRAFRFRRFLAPGDYLFELELEEAESLARARVLDGSGLCCEGLLQWGRP